MTTVEVMPTTALEALVEEQQNKEASQQRSEEWVGNKEMVP